MNKYDQWIIEALRRNNKKSRPSEILKTINELHPKKDDEGISRKTLHLHLKNVDPKKIRKISINGQHVEYELMEPNFALNLGRTISLRGYSPQEFREMESSERRQAISENLDSWFKMYLRAVFTDIFPTPKGLEKTYRDVLRINKKNFITALSQYLEYEPTYTMNHLRTLVEKHGIV